MSNVEHLTIEEAADRLGVSIATARRWATSGQISARKSGRQWIVDGSRLPSRRHSRSRGAPADIDFARALVHVRRTDLGEPPVPDVLQCADELEDEDGLLAAAAEHFDRSPGPPVEVEVDKDPLFTRRTILLELEDRIAYQAAVAAIAPKVEAQTSGHVFSARLSDDPQYFLKKGTTQWVAWRRATLKEIGPDSQWMLATDLTSYFDTIPHRSLLAEVESLNPDPTVVAALRAMLAEWSPAEGYGVPQGMNASRLLGNLFLLPVDRAMTAEGWRYLRYLDDVRIVTSSRSEAIRALRQFQQECRRRGLIVSSSKTELLHGEEAIASLRDLEDLAAADYLMEANATNLARSQLKRILQRALADETHPDTTRLRFSLFRLAQLGEGGVLRTVLKRLEDLAPVASILATYLRPFISRKSVVRGIGSFLANKDRSQSPHLVAWLLAAIIEHPGRMPDVWVEQASRRLKDKNEPVYVRATAAIAVARGGRSADLSWLQKDLQREHDPVVLRGYAVALHWAGALTKTTQRRLITRAPRLAKTISYLQGRTTLPSLVYRDRQLQIGSPC